MDGNPRSDGGAAGQMDMEYLKSIPGILKLSEFVSIARSNDPLIKDGTSICTFYTQTTILHGKACKV